MGPDTSRTSAALPCAPFPEALPGKLEDAAVVEGQGRQRIEGMPRRLDSVIAGPRLYLARIDAHQECDAHRPATRIASGVAERVHLRQAIHRKPGLFEQLAG